MASDSDAEELFYDAPEDVAHHHQHHHQHHQHQHHHHGGGTPAPSPSKVAQPTPKGASGDPQTDCEPRALEVKPNDPKETLMQGAIKRKAGVLSSLQLQRA
ncbi:hypothetical protein JRQ81_007309 [Phrynocephalus forsythii]|uniref:Uncharacterized protein n=1 Tax=Phrynocephalus forsythii TaxID=171643 RepID=A0A9Q0XEY3_9SAUR|nr:hypothetical protein JRQ81_007309 [Phrynocephalus forsythii]